MAPLVVNAPAIIKKFLTASPCKNEGRFKPPKALCAKLALVAPKGIRVAPSIAALPIGLFATCLTVLVIFLTSLPNPYLCLTSPPSANLPAYEAAVPGSEYSEKD